MRTLTLKRLLTATVFFVCLCATPLVNAGNYYVKRGQEITLRCTAKAPAGTITHAIFEVVNTEDAKYLGLKEYDTRAQTAKFIGLQTKSNIKVRCTYYYSFRGSYSGNMEVGHGSYTDYITVQGGVKPTDININPSDIYMKVGETVKAEVVLTPSNAEPDYTYGYIQTLSSPSSYFQWDFNDGVFTITAKKAGSLYLAAQVSDKIVGFCVVHATKDGNNKITPTDIKLPLIEKPLSVGQSMKMEYTVLPMGAPTEVTWKVSDESVASVNSSGTVVAKKAGEVQITATTPNGVSKTISLTIAPKVKSVSLPANASVVLGYAYQLTPSITPTDASADLTWSSSDSTMAKVSATGHVTCFKEGNVTITAQQGEDLTATTSLTIANPATGLNAVNAAIRIEEINAIANRILLNIK